MAQQSQKIGLVIVDHGSRRSEPGAVLLDVVESIRARELFSFVAGAHMDLEQPSLKSAIETCFSQGVARVVVVPFFLAPGRHSATDIPQLIEESFPGELGRRIVLGEPIGTHPGLLRVVADRALQAAGSIQGGSVDSMPLLLSPAQTVLLVIDLQAALMPHIQHGEQVIAASSYLIKAARELNLPILISEQYPKGLGRTDQRILDLLSEDTTAVEKTCFGALASEAFCAQLPAHRRQPLICGVESHVCVMQTALQAKEAGYAPFVVLEAIGSRKASDHEAALERMKQAGVALVSAEMAVYELLQQAGTSSFKALLPMMKDGIV